MDVQSLIQEWRGRRVDFNHKATYLETDLIQEYLFECYGENVQIETLRTFWEHPTIAFEAKFYRVEDTNVQDGDIVFMRDFTHAGIATGQQDGVRFEVLEQNAVGSQTGIGDDAIRENFYPKTDMVAIWRPRVKAQYVAPAPVTEPEPSPEPEAPKAVVQKPHRFAHGGLKIDLHLEPIFLKVKVDAYPSAMAAASHTNPLPKLVHAGSYQTDLTKLGMKRLVTDSRVTGETWINPADNTVEVKPAPSLIRPPQLAYQPDLDGVKEAEENYVDFKHDNGQLQEKYYTAKEGGAFVLDFKTGNQRRMPANAHVWLAGYTRVGEMGYGIATKCLENQDGTPREQPLWIGIRLGDLFEDETFNKQTTVEERQFFRTLRLTDYPEIAKAKMHKTIQGIIRKG